jgi:2-dehydro-3-deoxyphosphogluconate aldolase/(4S)-4-hydroxy-2-oxoglutarate aldolase
MTNSIENRLRGAPVVPLVQSDDPEVATLTTKALVAGGLTVIEVVMRTEGALVCMEEIAKSVPDAIVGAGTVLSSEQAEAAISCGAQFIVSPGLYPPVVDVAKANGLMMFPGVSTATEAQQAWNMGLRTLKFFPASLAGGPAMLKALSSVFRDVNFMPTGGVSTENLPDYLAVPSVLACGGSWLTPAKEIAAGNYDAITRLAAEAVAIANKQRA